MDQDRPDRMAMSRRSMVGALAAGALAPGTSSAAPTNADLTWLELPTRQAIAGQVIARQVTRLRVQGFAVAGDGGDAIYRRGEPSESFSIRSSDGASWVLARQRLDVRMFGAFGDGEKDDRAALQAAVDSAAALGGGTVHVPGGTYRLTHGSAEDGIGAVALTLRSGVALVGEDAGSTVLKLADAQLGPGTFARVLASAPASRRIRIACLTVDGNREGQGGEAGARNGAAIMFGNPEGAECHDVTLSDVRVRGANGQGIQITGHPQRPSTAIRIERCIVEQCSFIGIQVSQFEGLVIVENEIQGCDDNGIDLYGDDDIHHSVTVTAHRALIANNRIVRCSVGVFLETVGQVQAVGNMVDLCRGSGVHINRIHGAPADLLVTANRVSGTPIGLSVSGDAGSAVLSGNLISDFSKAGIQLGIESFSNVSNLVIANNSFGEVDPQRPLILGASTPAQLAFVRIIDNYFFGEHAPDRLFVNRFAHNVNVFPGGFIGVQGQPGPDSSRLFGQFGRLQITRAAPKTAEEAGLPGEIAIDDDFIYVRTAGGWRRAALQSW